MFQCLLLQKILLMSADICILNQDFTGQNEQDLKKKTKNHKTWYRLLKSPLNLKIITSNILAGSRNFENFDRSATAV